MRTTPQLRAKLEAAATSSGRSLVQEVEYRLEVSFAADGFIGGRFATLQRMINLAIGVAADGPDADQVVHTAIKIICEAFFAPDLTPEIFKRFGIVAALKNEGASGPHWRALNVAGIVLINAGLLPESILQLTPEGEAK
jgi:hypothetical protein